MRHKNKMKLICEIMIYSDNQRISEQITYIFFGWKTKTVWVYSAWIASIIGYLQ